MNAPAPQGRRFDKVAICSVLGDPSDPAVWSAAPYNLANALERLGVTVDRIHSGPTRPQLGLLALRYTMAGFGTPPSTEAIRRTTTARRLSLTRLQHALRGRNIAHVLHTGIFDMPMAGLRDGVAHYLYCDDDWTFSLPFRTDRARYAAPAAAVFGACDRRAMAQAAHVFTFSEHLRRHMIAHYGLTPDRVTAVGCGMGRIEPYHGPKNYRAGQLLFVAKHLFVQKGGLLLLDAFRLARRQLPHLSLTIVGDARSRHLVERGAEHDTGIEIRDHLPWDQLQALYRQATLLVQPMLNDPWGQVYVEALASRTPVLGLNRNGLPQITENGRHGFLVDRPDPEALAAAIVEAMADPDRLARMGRSGQAHVLQHYSWDEVARRIALIPPQPVPDQTLPAIANA